VDGGGGCRAPGGCGQGPALHACRERPDALRSAPCQGWGDDGLGLHEAMAIFAASSDFWDRLGVPLECRAPASKRLEGVFWHVGSKVPGSAWVSKSHFARFARDSRGNAHRWFAIQLGEPLGLLKAAVMEGEDKQSEWQNSASLAQIITKRDYGRRARRA
jgi:hypothetical protein